MTNDQTRHDEPGTRPAKPGEVCTCGASAEVIFETARFGDVPYCGGHAGEGRAPRACPTGSRSQLGAGSEVSNSGGSEVGHPGGLEAEVAELRAELAELRAELAELRAELATEVVTRRLVVVDERGRERIYTTVRPGSAELVVEHPQKGGAGPRVTMTASGGGLERAAVNVWTRDEVGVMIESSVNEEGIDAEVAISGPAGVDDPATRYLRALPVEVTRTAEVPANDFCRAAWFAASYRATTDNVRGNIGWIRRYLINSAVEVAGAKRTAELKGKAPTNVEAAGIRAAWPFAHELRAAVEELVDVLYLEADILDAVEQKYPPVPPAA